MSEEVRKSDEATERRSDGGCCAKGVARKIGIGAAVVAVPLAAFGIYQALEKAGEPGDSVPGKEMSLDAALRQVDSSLIKYKESGRIETGFSAPRAIAVDSKGNLLVGAEGIIRRFSKTGSVLGEVAISGTPYCIAAIADESLLVGFKEHIEIYGAAGKLARAWQSFGEKAYLTCIAIDGNDVWVADAGRRVVVHCDRDGKVLGEIGKGDPSKRVLGLNLPSPHLDVAVDADGLVWVNNTGLHRLEGYTRDGQLERFWGTAGNTIEAFPGCCNPADFAVLKDGSFIVAEKVTPRVKQYAKDGTFLGVVAAPNLFGQNMTGIDVAADGDGRVILMERGKREVRIFVANQGAI